MNTAIITGTDGERVVVDNDTGEVIGTIDEGQVDKTAVVRYEAADYAPAPLLTPEEVIERKAARDRMIADNLKEGVDFGTIPGTHKPSLYKAGAEQVASWYGYALTFPRALARYTEDWDAGLLDYNYTCRLMDRRTGTVVAECEGSCNSRERKYRNVTPADIKNTLQKMAQKRAMIGAVLFGCALSDRFTQDVEDTGVHDDVPENPLDWVLPFGKHKGDTVATLLTTQRGYLNWALGKMDSMPNSVKEAIRSELSGADGGEGGEESPPPPADPMDMDAARKELPAEQAQIDMIHGMIEERAVSEEELKKLYARLAKTMTMAEADGALSWLREKPFKPEYADMP